MVERIKRCGVNRKTVAKRRKRVPVEDAPKGVGREALGGLSEAKKAVCAAFGKHRPGALDDRLYALRSSIQDWTRSSLHRLVQRRETSRLPETDGMKAKKRVKTDPTRSAGRGGS